ncbi:MAG: ATP-dependent DNA helicase PcrA [Myxococcota bacterium]|nr:ATP-dependent DNA helicase PcrA [Myxococcota bacterium]
MARGYTLKTTSTQVEAPERIKYRSELNGEQYAVVTAGAGPILVLAGAGSGKTRALTYRVARLIEKGVSPQSIILLTFTNKAAREMTGRVEALIPGAGRRILSGTFHHAANVILRESAEALGYRPNYSIMDGEDVRDLMSAAIAANRADTGRERFPQADVLAAMVSFAINTQQTLEQVIERKYPYFWNPREAIIQTARTFVARKAEMNLMDFDDLLLNLKALLRDHPETGGLYADRFQHVLVDEYQDLNRLQSDIVDLLAAKHRNLTVVGDDCQSIYSFRGADFNHIMDFPQRYPDAKVFRLEVNFRSTPQILAVANAAIARNQRQFKKELRAVREPGALPALVSLSSGDMQARFVAQRVLELRDEGVPLDGMAVLYRAHSHALELQLELSRRGIPYLVRSGVRFFEQAHIKDVLAFLRIVYNPLEELSWLRVLRLYSGVGNMAAKRLWEALSAAGAPMDHLFDPAVESAVNKRAREGWGRCRLLLRELNQPELRRAPGTSITRILDEGYRAFAEGKFQNTSARLDDIRQLADFASRFASVDDFLAELALIQSISAEDVAAGKEPDEMLTLSSVHQAKGLEWRAVFVIHLADGRFPSANSLATVEGEEEERRLFYVAVTRAKDELYLTWPIMHQGRDYELIQMKPSRFITEVLDAQPPDHPLVETWEVTQSIEEESGAGQLPGGPPPLLE